MEEIKKSFKHLVFTRFDVHSASALDKDWLKYRLKIFEKYTLQSLINQDTKNFALWIRYAPDFFEEAKEFNEYLKTMSFPVFFTIFKDGEDKKTEELNDYVKDVDIVVDTRIDSDDMYSHDALSIIQSQDLDVNQAYIFLNGYLYRESTNQLFLYKGTAAPFYTMTYPKDVFVDQKKKKAYFPYLPDPSQHPGYKILPDDKYMVIVHQKNSTGYSEDWVKKAKMESSAMNNIQKSSIVIRNRDKILNSFKKWNQ
jgi:hypothetical protein